MSWNFQTPLTHLKIVSKYLNYSIPSRKITANFSRCLTCPVCTNRHLQTFFFNLSAGYTHPCDSCQFVILWVVPVFHRSDKLINLVKIEDTCSILSQIYFEDFYEHRIAILNLQVLWKWFLWNLNLFALNLVSFFTCLTFSTSCCKVRLRKGFSSKNSRRSIPRIYEVKESLVN